MDNYSVSPAIADISNPGGEKAEFQPPLYVFDSQVMLEHFSPHYILPGLRKLFINKCVVDNEVCT